MKQRHRADNFILFVVKRREDPDLGYSTSLASGVRTSITFVVDVLTQNGVRAALVEVTDNNDIDAVVSRYKPSFCIIEALWVTPAKFDELARLHPTVTWVVRCHSEIAFLACEAIAVEWLIDYARRPNVLLAANTAAARADVLAILHAAYPAMPDAALAARVLHLPNCYPAVAPNPKRRPPAGTVINIGCFGAVRLLKNHLIQAVAALRLSEIMQQPVHFHVNATRVESQGAPVLKSLRALFAHAPYAMLVEHDWLEREAFLALLRGMDVSSQVSMTETFNIVTADAVACGVPVVASAEVDWLDSRFFALPTSSDDILAHLRQAFAAGDGALAHQARCLNAYSTRAAQNWLAEVA